MGGFLCCCFGGDRYKHKRYPIVYFKRFSLPTDVKEFQVVKVHQFHHPRDDFVIPAKHQTSKAVNVVGKVYQSDLGGHIVTGTEVLINRLQSELAEGDSGNVYIHQILGFVSVAPEIDYEPFDPMVLATQTF